MERTVLRRSARPALLALLLATAGLAEAAHAACDVAALDPIVDEPAQAWLDRLPGRLAAPLAEDGFAFPEPGFIEACPDLIPALLVVERPADELFARLIQTARHGEFMREIGSVDPISRSTTDAVDRYSMPVLFSRIDYTIRHTWDADARRIRWALSSDHESDLRRVAGLWEVHRLGPSRSLLVYASVVEVGPIVPRMLQERITRRSLRAIVASAYGWLSEVDLALR